jgi:AcrR family transcriptional regulator
VTRITAAKRPRAEHLGPERRRPLVLDAALRVFLEHGYRGTSMQAIAEAAGVTKPVVYECFGSKDALLLALLDREEARLLEAIVAALPQRLSLANPEAMVAAGLSAFLTAATQRSDAWAIVFDSQHGSTSVVTDRIRTARAMLVGRLRGVVHSHLLTVEGADADREAPVLAELVAALAESSARMLVADKIPWTAAELSAYVARLITGSRR